MPYLGICLGMQIALSEIARNVLGYTDANSAELDPDTAHPVIDLMPVSYTHLDVYKRQTLNQPLLCIILATVFSVVP